MTELHSLVDFGLCIVLWLVQIVIYPSFLRTDESRLIAWHKTYTFRVSFIIIPLVVAQLILSVVAALSESALWLDWFVLGLILICWVLTFFVSVPLHLKISRGDSTQEIRKRLIWTNWPRTVLWTVIFVLGFFSRSDIPVAF